MLFPWALARSETQTTSTRIWAWDTNSISYDDHRYAKHVSQLVVFVFIQLLRFEQFLSRV